MSWSDAHVELLRKLHSAGLSASQIAYDLCRQFPGSGYSRNAIIGKAHRLGLGPIGGGKASKPSLPHRKPTTPRGGAGQLAAAKARAPAVRANPANKNTLGAKSMMAPTDLKDRVLLKNTVALEPESASFAPAPDAKPIPFIERTRLRCSWHIGGDIGPDMLCCGAPVPDDGGLAFCIAHRERARNKTAKPKTGSDLVRSLRKYAA